jgi:hypothetical protein
MGTTDLLIKSKFAVIISLVAKTRFQVAADYVLSGLVSGLWLEQNFQEISIYPSLRFKIYGKLLCREKPGTSP